MQTDEVMNLAASASQLMTQFERNCDQLNRVHTDGAQRLQQLAREAPELLRQAAQSSIGEVSSRVQAQLNAGVGRSAEVFNRKLLEAGDRIDSLNRNSTQLAQRMERVANRLWWAQACLLLSSLVVLIGGSLLSRHYYQQIRQNQIAAELLKAYNEADVTLCEGRLCANVDSKAKGVGEHGNYKPVRPRK